MSKVVLQLILLLLLLFCESTLSAPLTCLDENQNPVPWIYMYKLPKHVSPNGNGLDFLYLHSNSNGWQMAKYPIDDVRSIPGALISQLSPSDLVLMYNDEPPEAESDETRGHTKGVVAGNVQGGFWLVHSVPKYPGNNYSDYSYPPTGHLYGQSFLCWSMNASELDQAGTLIAYNEPHVYVGQVPEGLTSTYPNLQRVATEQPWIRDPPFFKTSTINDFTVFSKSHKFQKELYVDWVAPALNSDLLVESWLHGPGVITTDCDKPFKVYNVDHITLPVIGKQFSSMEDHSKWTVGKSMDWICVGDINRAEHQKKRGGGTVCRYDKYAANAYRKLVNSLYPCPRNASSFYNV